MRIIIDADATPRSARNICEEVGKQCGIEVESISEIDRSFKDSNADVKDLTNRDYTIAAITTPEDIVVTMDYTLASEVYETALAAIHPKGFVYSSANMDELLYERFMQNKAREAGKGPTISKRSVKEDRAFTALLLDLVTPVSKSGIAGFK